MCWLEKYVLSKSAEWVGALSLSIGLVIAVVQYSNYKDEVSANRSFEIVSELNSERSWEHRANLSPIRIDMQLLLMEYLSSEEVEENGAEKDANQFYHYMVNDIASAPSVYISIDNAFSLYHKASECIKVGLCDDKVIGSMLRPYANAFLKSWYPYGCRDEIRSAWTSVYRRFAGGEYRCDYLVETGETSVYHQFLRLKMLDEQ
ncbi:hypothetical protein [Billgrantia montanilacus]|uniref:hypothetical protein n=1 Tax=Billgrantia montanilacus TaxID=2282305 RepID=UPI0011C06EBC|nr:hypothetical protein [Halomonas montanilacus]